jgi:ubiquinone/menaquinone biosynthesis C-methylase UbiE
MTSTEEAVDQDRALKARHRAMWALGDYSVVAEEVIPELGPVLVEACEVGPGDRVLDVAAGTGNAALPAARRGARVVATDLTPELLARGERLAAAEDLALEWTEADAEQLPYEDASFDVVLSCVGVMFAPHHQRTADELVRVCRAGGRIGLLSWTPEGFIGQMFATMKPYVPPPPAGASPPPLWGREDHVRELLADRITDLRMERRLLQIDRFGTAEEFRDLFKRVYGPTVAAYRNIAAEPERVAALDADLAGLAQRFGIGDGATTPKGWEYLVVTARCSG